MKRSNRLKKQELDLFIALLKRSKNDIKLIYKELFENVKKTITMKRFREYVDFNNITEIKKLLQEHGGLSVFENKLRDSFHKNGVVLGRKQSQLLNNVFGINLNRALLSRDYMSVFGGIVDDQVVKLTKQLSDEMLQTITDLIRNNRARNITTSGTIRDLKRFIPLSPRQAESLAIYKQRIIDKGVAARFILDDPEATTSQITRAERDFSRLSDVEKIIDSKTKRMMSIRAESVARNESSSFINRLKYEQYKGAVEIDTNREYLKEWVCIEDDRTRDTHLHLAERYGDGNGIDMKEYFYGGVSPLLHPRDPGGDPSDVMNCRCTLVLEVGELVAGP